MNPIQEGSSPVRTTPASTQPWHQRVIRPAGPGDADATAEVLAAAFLHGDLTPWLIPDLPERTKIYQPYFTLLVEHAVHHGHLLVAEHPDNGIIAASIWYPIVYDSPPAAPDYQRRLADITGPHLQRFKALDTATHRHHPYNLWHQHLAHLAVHPDHQRHGLGSAMLAYNHDILDRGGTLAYLQATGPASTRWFARHGYRAGRQYRITDNGPEIVPMWRPPVSRSPLPGGSR